MPEPATPPTRRLALLIDCDNAQAALMEKVFNEALKFGEITIRRGYGDWSAINLKRWKEVFHKLAIQPVHQFSKKSKSSTDIAIIIDAMDILHAARVDGFCIYSGDSDYTRLIMRLREAGQQVIGFGLRNKSAEELVHAFDRFIYTDNLERPKTTDKAAGTGHKQVGKLKDLLAKAYDNVMETSADEDKIYLSQFVDAIRKIDPAFDPRSYGYAQHKKLIASLDPLYTITRQADVDYVSRKT